MRRVNKGLVNKLPLKTQWPMTYPFACTSTASEEMYLINWLTLGNRDAVSECLPFSKDNWQNQPQYEFVMRRFQALGRLGWERFGGCGENFQTLFESLLSPSRFPSLLLGLSSVKYRIGGWVNACPDWKLDILSTLTDCVLIISNKTIVSDLR